MSSAEPGDRWGRLVLVSATAPKAGVFVTTLSCERTHMAGGRGACLRQDRQTSTYFLDIFDDAFTTRHRVPLTGVPSRTRVSPDGRWVAATVFEHGHSYAEDGFSTRTTLVDAATGRVYADLEQFEVERDGHRFKEATLSSAGVNYLVIGRVSTRHLDDGDVIYQMVGPSGANVWSIAIDGSAAPSLLVEHAFSPSVIR